MTIRHFRIELDRLLIRGDRAIQATAPLPHRPDIVMRPLELRLEADRLLIGRDGVVRALEVIERVAAQEMGGGISGIQFERTIEGGQSGGVFFSAIASQAQ